MDTRRHLAGETVETGGSRLIEAIRRLTCVALRVRRRRAAVVLAPLTAALAVALHPAGAAGPRVAEGDDLGTHIAVRYTGSLDEVLERRYLRVLTSRNSFDYFIYQGSHAGYQYEMVRAFAQHLNRKFVKGRREPKIQFEIIPVRSEDLIPMLLAGRGDMIAARLTVTKGRAGRVLFSRPYREVDEQVVAHRRELARGPVRDLAGRRVAVRRSSSYHASLVAESRRLQAAGRPAIEIIEVDEALETEDVLGLVANGRFPFTVADSIVAQTAVEIYDELVVLPQLTLRRDAKLAWATHTSARKLAAEMDVFLAKYRHGSLLGNITAKKYFENHARLQARIEAGDRIVLSPYDGLFRRYGEKYGFDWRLVAAMAYQESRFRAKAHNRSGATGLFQIKPQTAREPYVDVHPVAGLENVENNVHAGVKYLAWIKQRYFDDEPGMRERDRLRMALAAYNAGPRAIINARRRAEKLGYDPNRWFRSVELALLDMRKTEPVKYVSEINQRYLSYLMLGVE